MPSKEPTKAEILAAWGGLPKPTQNGRPMPYVKPVTKPAPKPSPKR